MSLTPTPRTNLHVISKKLILYISIVDSIPPQSLELFRGSQFKNADHEIVCGIDKDFCRLLVHTFYFSLKVLWCKRRSLSKSVPSCFKRSLFSYWLNDCRNCFFRYGLRFIHRFTRFLTILSWTCRFVWASSLWKVRDDDVVAVLNRKDTNNLINFFRVSTESLLVQKIIVFQHFNISFVGIFYISLFSGNFQSDIFLCFCWYFDSYLFYFSISCKYTISSITIFVWFFVLK